MIYPYPISGAHQIDNLLPCWKYDILIVETCQPYLPSVLKSDAEHCEKVDNNYFWDLLPEIFSGKKLKSNPTGWIPFLQSEQIGLTNLILNNPVHDPYPPLHAHYLNPNHQEKCDPTIWNTDAILNIIRENKISAVFIIDKECTLPVEPEIEKIKSAALLNEIYFGRLGSPSIPSELQPHEKAIHYTNLFSNWFESLSPVIRVRVR